MLKNWSWFAVAVALYPHPTQAEGWAERRLGRESVVVVSASTLAISPDVGPTLPHLSNSPRYSPYERWLLPRLPAGAVLYNRPCTFSDGITTSTVPCPGTLVPPAVYVAVPARLVTTVRVSRSASVTTRYLRARKTAAVRSSRALLPRSSRVPHLGRMMTVQHVLRSPVPMIAPCPQHGPFVSCASGPVLSKYDRGEGANLVRSAFRPNSSPMKR